MTLLAILLLLPCGAALFVGTVSHAMLWYECRGTPHETRLRGMAEAAGLTPPLWLAKRVLAAFQSQLLLMITFPLGWIGPLWRPTEEAKDARGPVLILLHGLYHNPAAWLFARGRFRRAGYGRQFVLSYGSWNKGFEAVAADLMDETRRIVAAHPGREIVLIGHSLGGLLARRMLTDPEIAAACAALLTLGSPHRGSRLSAFGPGRMARDIHPSSPVMAAMRAQLPAPSVPGLALVSPVDAMVLPPDNLVPPEGSGITLGETVLCDHVQMVFHPGVFARMLDWLGRVAPAK